jgi:GNAT superfamily N-acetyltransferase
MATAPEHQRKGMGRALLSQVIGDYRRHGVERFHLGATEAGRPLYTSLGFVLVADLSVWFLERPVSAQDQKAMDESVPDVRQGSKPAVGFSP